jgi:hypothetical protein
MGKEVRPRLKSGQDSVPCVSIPLSDSQFRYSSLVSALLHC